MLRSLNLGVRFLLELVLLFSLGYWGFHVEVSIFIKWALGLGLPVITAIVWGLFLSPKATVKLPLVVRLLMELILFGAAFLALYACGFEIFAVTFGIVVILNRLLIIVWKQ